MPLPEPVPGLVIRYDYLWYHEYVSGREEGGKDRPCAIIAAVQLHPDRETRVLVLPITHRPPEQPSFAVEIPQRVKERLNLDFDRSWVTLTEWCAFRKFPDGGFGKSRTVISVSSGQGFR